MAESDIDEEKPTADLEFGNKMEFAQLSGRAAFHRNLYLAGLCEWCLTLLIGALLVAGTFGSYSSERVVGIDGSYEPLAFNEVLVRTITTPLAAFAGLYVFMVTIQLMLFHVTPLVALVYRGIRTTSFLNPFLGPKVYGDQLLDRDSITLSAGQHEKIPLTEAARLINPNDPVEISLKHAISRSRSTSQTAQWRPNVLLLVGTFVAAFGLLFFFLTLPQIAASKIDFTAKIVEMLPRLLMLLFIQVLAGFFLRQYRSSMEEFRYYEAVLRNREDIFVSYVLRKELNQPTLMADLSEQILLPRDFARLAKEETTTIIESQKATGNEFDSVGRQVIDLVRGVKFESVGKSRDGT